MPIPRRLLLQQQQHASPTNIAATTTATSSSTPPPSPSQPLQALPPDSNVVLILAALLCAFICVAGLAFVARCAWLRRRVLRATGHLPATPPSPPPPAKGIDTKVLQALPKLPFHPDLLTRPAATPAAGTSGKPLAIAADCAICLTEFATGDEVRVLPQCGHGFHAPCVDAWLKTTSSCPSCRRVVVVVDTTAAAAADAGARCAKCGKPAGATRSVAASAGFLP